LTQDTTPHPHRTLGTGRRGLLRLSSSFSSSNPPVPDAGSRALGPAYVAGWRTRRSWWLEQVVTALDVERAAGRAHCAGSDSLLIIDVLLAMLNRFFTSVDVLTHTVTIVGLA